MAGLLFVTGCKNAPPAAVPEPKPIIVESPPLPREKPKPPPQKPARNPPAPAAAAPPVNRPSPGADIELVGVSQTEIRALLGEPDMQKDLGAGQSWVYRGTGCSVELAFFFDVSRSGFYVLDRHVSSTGGGEADAQLCLRGIRDRRALP